MYIDDQGYCVVKAVHRKVVYGHRQVMELILKRKLRSNEIVHHKDGRKWNNCPFNLEVMTSSNHRRAHKYSRGNSYSDRELLIALIKTYEKLGRWPKMREHKTQDGSTYHKRFGSWIAARTAAQRLKDDLASH